MVTASRTSFLVAALTGALILSAWAGAAVNGSAAGWVTSPRRIVQGSPMKIEVSVPKGTRCSISFRYKNRAAQKGLRPITVAGRTGAWQWTVPRNATPGAARGTVSCSGHGSRSFTVMIIGEVIPASIDVVKQGFSVRPRRGSGSDASWGVLLKNSSPSDALQVVVLANFVMPDNKLIASATVRVGRIPAGMEHATGGDLSFTWVPPVARLEIVVQIGESGRKGRTFPSIANVRILPARHDFNIVGSVEGEVVNDNALKTLERADLSTIVMDAAGNILGGRTGSANASLPPGAREFFKISGMYGVTFANAASAQVSVTPRYRGDR